MVKYTCPKCFRTFDKKDSCVKHINRKTSCIDNQNPIMEVIERLKLKIENLEYLHGIRTGAKINKMCKQMYDMLVKVEKMSYEDALNQFNYVYSIHLLEPLIKSGSINLPIRCTFSNIIAEPENTQNALLNEIMESFSKNSRTNKYFNKYLIKNPYCVKQLISQINQID